MQRFWLLVEDSESSKILTKLLFTLRKFQLNSRLRFCTFTFTFTFCAPSACPCSLPGPATFLDVAPDLRAEVV